MNDANDIHPDFERLVAFDRGQLPPDESSAIETHLTRCDACCNKLDMVGDDALIDLLRAANGSSDAADVNEAGTQAATPDIVSKTLVLPPQLADHPRYHIVGFLGSGGMGAVYKAEHRIMHRIVALKILNEELMNQPTAMDRFRQEVQAAARLTHPNIVTAFDADQEGNLHFLVMEFVEGITLDRLVQQHGPLPVADACACIRQAAQGLQHAFERGMVHRDIKPANLLRTPDGQIKILDFGLAHFVSERTEGSSLTKEGTIVGTPEYMAPEQARDAHRADIRADIYSLGCTFYYLLAGQPPFNQGTALQKLLAHQDQTPRSLTEFRNDVPAAIVALVERMLAKDPARRVQTPAEIVAALAPHVTSATGETLRKSTDRSSPTASKEAASKGSNGTRRRFFQPLAICGAIVLLIGVAAVGTGIWSSMRNSGEPAGTQPSSPTVAVAPNPTTPDGSKTAARPDTPPVDKRAEKPEPTEPRITPPPPLKPSGKPASAEQPGIPFANDDPREKAVAWVRDNNRGGPKHFMVPDLAERFEKAGSGTGFQLWIGGENLNPIGGPVFLTGWNGELFVFPIPAERSKEVKIFDKPTGGFRPLDSNMIIYHLGFDDKATRGSRQLFRLSAPQIDNADKLDGNKMIVGRVAFQRLSQEPGHYCMRLTAVLAKGRYSSECPIKGGLPADNQPLEFRFMPLHADGINHAGPLPLLIELCSVTDSDRKVQVVSNCAATLVYVAAPP